MNLSSQLGKLDNATQRVRVANSMTYENNSKTYDRNS